MGLVGGLAAASAMRRLWYGVTPLDPFNVAGVVALLAMVTLAASLVPAWKATRVDVVEALQNSRFKRQPGATVVTRIARAPFV